MKLLTIALLTLISVPFAAAPAAPIDAVASHAALATAPDAQYGGWKVDVDNDYDLILEKSAKDTNVDVTNDGPGDIFVLSWDEDYNFTETIIEAGKSRLIPVTKGGGFGIGLQSGTDASGSYKAS